MIPISSILNQFEVLNDVVPEIGVGFQVSRAVEVVDFVESGKYSLVIGVRFPLALFSNL